MDIPPEKLKFMDEAHVVERDLLKKKKVLTMVNKRKWVPDQSLHGKGFTIMLLLTLDPNKPRYINLNFENNSGTDVLLFVSSAIRERIFIPFVLFDSPHTNSF